MITYKFPQLYEFSFKFPPLLIWRKKSVRVLIKELKKLDINVEKILDVGCGTGVLIPELKKLYKEAVIVGIDMSYNMINSAQKKYREDAKFIVINFLNCVGNYDLILLFYSLPFIELKAGLTKVMELLNKNGVCIIITTQKALFSVIHKLLVKIFLRTQIYLYSPKEIISCLPTIAEEEELAMTKKNKLAVSYLSSSSMYVIKIRIINEIEGSFFFLLKK